MNTQENKLILDLYIHYKSANEISEDDLNSLYDKYGNIRGVLKNLIQEFDPESAISEEYLDEKLKSYSISETSESNIKKSLNHNKRIDIKKTNKSKNNIYILFTGFLLIGIIVWLLIERENKKNSDRNEIELNQNSNIENIDEEKVVIKSVQNLNKTYVKDEDSSSTNENNDSEKNSSETSLQNYSVAIIINEKTYFYEYPKFEKKRKAYLVKGDYIQITEELNDFVNVIFTNSQGKTTTGWIPKNDIELTEIAK